jgi:RNA polymerase sigma factor (sigma-70 family)
VRTVRPSDFRDETALMLRELEPEIRRLFVRFSVPYQDWEDLLQDCLLGLVRDRARVVSPKRWLLGAVANRCRMYWRSRRRDLVEAVDTAMLEEVARPAEPDDRRVGLNRDLTAAISGLPVHCRSILRLRYGLDRDSCEVATALGYSPGSIRQVTNRCLYALTRCLLDLGYSQNEELACAPVT